MNHTRTHGSRVLAALALALASSCAADHGPDPGAASGSGAGSASTSSGAGSVTLDVIPAGDGTGTVTSYPAGIQCGPTCAVNLPMGTVATLHAWADEHSEFTSWSAACSEDVACAVTLDASTEVVATFSATEFPLDVILAGAGSGKVSGGDIDCGATCAAWVPRDTSVTLDATPDATSTFTGWSGACAGMGPCTVLLSEARSITANFASAGGAFGWATHFGVTDFAGGDGGPFGIAADAAGNVVVVGTIYEGQADFGGIIVGAPDEMSAFVVKLAPTGDVLWARAFGPLALARHAAIDANGDVVFTGYFANSTGPMDLDGQLLWGWLDGDAFEDAYVAKLSGVDGAVLWARQMPGPGTDVGFDVAADGDGDVLVTGIQGSEIDLGGPTTTSGDIFVAKYAAVDGSHMWSHSFPNILGGGGIAGYPTGIDVDSSGNVFIAGALEYAMDFGGGYLTPTGPCACNPNIFVAKYSPDGQHLWSERFGGMEALGVDDQATALGVDAAGDVLLTGFFFKTVPLGDTAWTSQGQDDVFLLKLDGKDGGPLWSRTFGGVESEIAWGLAVAPNGDAVITGSTNEYLDLGGGVLPTASGAPIAEDLFVARYAGTDGAHIWSQRFGDASGLGYAEGVDVAVDGAGAPIVATRFAGTVDYGSGPITQTGPEGDLVILKLEP